MEQQHSTGGGYVWLLILFVLGGCASKPGPHTDVSSVDLPQWQQYYDSDGVSEVAILYPFEIYALPEEEKQAFVNWYQSPGNQSLAPHYRLSTFLERTLHGFTYNGNTHTATQAALIDNGNCLSLAVIATALARTVGIEIKFQKMHSPPLYKKDGDIMMVSSHVRTKAYEKIDTGVRHDNNGNMRLLLPGSVIIDYFPQYGNVKSTYVSQASVTAMFYRNKVAAALIDGSYDEAFWLADKALKLAPSDPENVAAMAVVLGRLNKNQQAEALYQRAIEAGITDITLLSNYHGRLSRQGRSTEAAEIEQLIARQDDDNPYSWIMLAKEQLARQNTLKAVFFLRKAEKLAPYLDDVYLELARSYYLQNKMDKAQKALTKAQTLAWDDETSQLYAAKKAALNALD